jgi:hypothetical protein
MIDMNRSRIVLAVGVLPIVVLLAACGSNPVGVAPAPVTTGTSSSGTAVAVESPPGGGGQATGVGSVGASKSGLCKAGDVSLSLGAGDSGAGTTYRPLIIKNISGHECTIQGFPGISYVGGQDGHQIGKAAFREGGKGDAVELAPGQSASAVIGFAQVANFDAATCQPEQIKGLRVYLPQETASLFLPLEGTGCASTAIPGNQLTVQTVHPGTAG